MTLKPKRLPMISNQPDLEFSAFETLQKFFMYFWLEIVTSFQNKGAIDFEVGLLLMTLGFFTQDRQTSLALITAPKKLTKPQPLLTTGTFNNLDEYQKHNTKWRSQIQEYAYYIILFIACSKTSTTNLICYN